MTGTPSPREPLRLQTTAERAERDRTEAFTRRMALLVAKLNRDGLYAASNGYVRAPREPRRTPASASRARQHGYRRPEAGEG